MNISSSLSPGTKGYSCNTQSKFGAAHIKDSVLNVLKYKYCVNKSRDMSSDHFAKNRKKLNNWWRVNVIIIKRYGTRRPKDLILGEISFCSWYHNERY